MIYRKPYYYDNFKCIAGDCPDTCCAGWAIVIDEKSIASYDELKGDTGRYVRSNIDYAEGTFKQCGNRCSFLNKANLCDLYIKAGEKSLCKTCKRYPRHFEIYGELIEAALSMSCPVAAKMIVTAPEAIHFQTKANEKASPYKKEVDRKLLDVLCKVRSKIFGISKCNCTMAEIMCKMLDYCELVQGKLFEYEKKNKLQRRLYRREKMDEIICDKQYYGIVKCGDKQSDRIVKCDDEQSDRIVKCSAKQHNRFVDCNTDKSDKIRIGVSKRIVEDNTKGSYSRRKTIQRFIDIIGSFENINEAWPEYLTKMRKNLYEDMDEEEYVKLAEEFEYIVEKNHGYVRNILDYFIYTYFMGGVYDYNILSMVKLAIVSTVIIKEMSMSYWLSHDKNISLDEFIKLCYVYSRQIEHSDDNLLDFEGLLSAHPAFAVDNIKLALTKS